MNIVFIHSSIDEYSGGFHSSAGVDNAVMNFSVLNLAWTRVFILLGNTWRSRKVE